MDFWVIFAFILGFIACLGLNWAVKRQALRLNNAKAGLKGVEAKADQTAELITMLGEIKEAFDRAKLDGKDIKQFAVQDLPAIVVRHPMLVAKYGSRLYKLIGKGEGMTGLEGLL